MQTWLFKPDSQRFALRIPSARYAMIALTLGTTQFVQAQVPRPAEPNRLEQVMCMRRMGACANFRDGGLPSPELIQRYDQQCREESNYPISGVPVELSAFSERICRAPLNWKEFNHHLLRQLRVETNQNDLEVLVRAFSDPRWIDDGTVPGRLEAILIADAHPLVPGLEGGIEFSDVGFRGDQNPNGSGFRDPHPESRDQIGHFLTGVGLAYDPSRVSRPIRVPVVGDASFPTWARVRDLLSAPPGASDQEVALRLMIGHELAPDPQDSEGTLALIRGFRRQFANVRPEYIANFLDASTLATRSLGRRAPRSGPPERLEMSAAEPLLRLIPINFSWRGNSIQDLRLTNVAFSLGTLIRTHYFQTGTQASAWLRANLGE